MNPIVSLAAAPSLAPASGLPILANLSAWYRKGFGLAESGGAGTGVTQWNDQSANAWHLTAAGTARPALQSDGTLLFDGTTDSLANASVNVAQPTTWYFRAKWVAHSSASNKALFDGNSARQLFQEDDASPNMRAFAGNLTDVTPTISAGNWQTFILTFNGASGFAQIDGNSQSSLNFGTNAITGLFVGSSNASNFANVQIAEIALYAAAHDAATRAAIKAYFDSR